MRVLQINARDVGGGAEQVALALFREYARRGHESTLAVGAAYTAEGGILELDGETARSAWARGWSSLSSGLAPFDGRVRGVGRVRRAAKIVGQPKRAWATGRGHEDFAFPGTKQLLDVSADVVHAHNLHGGYFDLRELPALSRSRPLFLTLHDTWLLSGHCAYSLGCERWIEGCGECPDLSIYPSVRRDATAFNWRRKQEIFAQSRLHIAAPSRWLLDRVERSMLMPGVVETRLIPNGVDTTVFRPGDRAAERLELGLPADTRILMTAADGLRLHEFKDFQLLRSAIGALQAGPVLVLAVGETAPDERHGDTIVRFVPRQEHPDLARYYRAADVYVHAARAETFGLTIVEAMACGTPVVATAVGGIPEVVTDARTGLVVPAGDARAFADALRSLLADNARRAAMGAEAAVEAGRRFDFARQADAYLEWYASALR